MSNRVFVDIRIVIVTLSFRPSIAPYLIGYDELAVRITSIDTATVSGGISHVHERVQL